MAKFRFDLIAGLICATVVSSSVAADEKPGWPDKVPDGTTALILFVDAKAMTPVYYRYAEYCEEALKTIEAKLREASPRLKVFGLCTRGAGDSLR